MQFTTLAGGAVLAVLVAAPAASAAEQTKTAPAASKADEGKEVRVVGCVQWEKDYRQARNEGRGGAIGTGTGIGVGNEYVLIFAQVEGPGGKRPAASAGAAGPGRKFSEGAVYSITGDREKELGRRVGQQIEVIGILEERGDPNSEHAGDLPRIKMTAWIPLKDFCPAP